MLIAAIISPINSPSKPSMYDSFKTKKTIKIANNSYVISSLKEAEKHGLLNISYLPFSIKVLLENLIRNEDGKSVTKEDIQGHVSGHLVYYKRPKHIEFASALPRNSMGKVQKNMLREQFKKLFEIS